MKELFNKEKFRNMEDELNTLFPYLNIRLTYLDDKYHLDAQLPSNTHLSLLRLIMKTWYPDGGICFPDYGEDVFWFRYRLRLIDDPELRFAKSGEISLYNFTNLLELKQYLQILINLCDLANRCANSLWK
jgi:hypothetical protein